MRKRKWLPWMPSSPAKSPRRRGAGPDGIRAYIERNLSGMNPLEAALDEALGDTDEAAAERCRRLFMAGGGSRRRSGPLDHEGRRQHRGRCRRLRRARGRRPPPLDGAHSSQASQRARLGPDTPRVCRRDAPAPGEILDGVPHPGMFRSSWKEFGRLSAAAQGKLEGLVMRMVAVSQARRSAQVAGFNRKFDDQTIPTTKEEADQLMADMVSEVIGRRVEPSTREVTDDTSVTQSSAHSDDRNGDPPRPLPAPRSGSGSRPRDRWSNVSCGCGRTR